MTLPPSIVAREKVQCAIGRAILQCAFEVMLFHEHLACDPTTRNEQSCVVFTKKYNGSELLQDKGSQHTVSTNDRNVYMGNCTARCPKTRDALPCANGKRKWIDQVE